MVQRNAILEELSAFRRQLQRHKVPYPSLFRLNPWIPVRDICMDWTTILLAVTALCFTSWWLTPVALVLIANRQRALGNILHDAGHRNLHRAPWLNDGIANLLVAPLMFTSMQKYRESHFLHHVNLGDSDGDPDYLVPATFEQKGGWAKSYLHQALNLRAWWASTVGDLGDTGTPLMSRLYMLGWWVVIGSLMCMAAGHAFAALFTALWFISRATLFHFITTFREMCDHYGLESGGVVSFSRDIAHHGLWSRFFHPRNNGYHLTHHLLPAVPYYSLPRAHRLIRTMPMYRLFDHLFISYWLGARPVVDQWNAKERM